MRIVSTILPPEKIIKTAETTFPDVKFEFYKDIDQAKESALDAEVLITYGDDVTVELLKEATKLKWIMVMSAGLEKMPLQACKEQGILVTNVRGIHKIPMAEFTIGLMLQHAKQAKQLFKNHAEKVWERRLPMAELHGKTILVIGVGTIGGEIARLSKAYGMTTLGINTSGKPVENVDSVYKIVDLKQVLPMADFIVNILPSTKHTRHVLSDNHFQLMKNTAVFINIGRGDMVKEKVLLKALETNQIAHAYLDVFEHEPLPQNHPFWIMENVSVTPHISSLTKNYLPRSFDIFYENLHTFRNKRNKYINEIDLKRGY